MECNKQNIAYQPPDDALRPACQEDAGACLLPAIRNAIDGVGFVLDERGQVMSTWARENSATCRPPESVVGKSIALYFGQRVLRELRPALARVLQTGVAENLVHVQNLSGARKWYSSRLTPIRAANGTIQNVCSFSRDITERKSLEERLVHAEKMEAIGRMAGGLSHDFNNILGVIQGTAELLSSNLGAGHAQHKYVAQLLHSTQSASILTQQLLAFSRQQAREPRIINLNDVVADVAPLVRRVVGEDIELCAILDPRLACAKVDANEVQRVIMNLVNNARDAMPKGGLICIETANAVLHEKQLPAHSAMLPGEYVVLSVRDTGVGMDAATLARIFEPFFTTKTGGRGTGLGLVSVSGIVNESGGFINTASEVGKGTCFHIYFPAFPEHVSWALVPSSSKLDVAMVARTDMTAPQPLAEPASASSPPSPCK